MYSFRQCQGQLRHVLTCRLTSEVSPLSCACFYELIECSFETMQTGALLVMWQIIKTDVH